MKIKNFVRKYDFSLNIVILIINVFILLMVLHNISLIERRVERFSADIALHEVSQDLNIEPYWADLIYYLNLHLNEGNRFTGEGGSSKEDVFYILDKMDHLKVETIEAEGNSFCDRVEFYGLAQRTHYPIYFCYSNENKLLTNISVNSDQ